VIKLELLLRTIWYSRNLIWSFTLLLKKIWMILSNYWKKVWKSQKLVIGQIWEKLLQILRVMMNLNLTWRHFLSISQEWIQGAKQQLILWIIHQSNQSQLQNNQSQTRLRKEEEGESSIKSLWIFSWLLFFVIMLLQSSLLLNQSLRKIKTSLSRQNTTQRVMTNNRKHSKKNSKHPLQMKLH